MRQFRTDVELVHPHIELGGRESSTVGFDLHRDIGQQREQLRQRRRLQHRLAPGDDQSPLAECQNPVGHILHLQRHLIGLAVERLARAVRALVTLEMPRIGGVAPHAGEVAARQAHEGGRLSCARPFALHGGENLRPAGVVGGEDEGHARAPLTHLTQCLGAKNLAASRARRTRVPKLEKYAVIGWSWQKSGQ